MEASGLVWLSASIAAPVRGRCEIGTLVAANDSVLFQPFRKSQLIELGSDPLIVTAKLLFRAHHAIGEAIQSKHCHSPWLKFSVSIAAAHHCAAV